MRVFVAGGTGAVGRRLVPQLVANDHQVVATTRKVSQADQLRVMGAEPVVVDGLDATGVGEAVAHAEPDAIIHQMTALAGKPNLRNFDRWFEVTNRLRTQGTENLLAAAMAAGVERFVVHSYTGWNNARTGGPVKTEDDPFDPKPVAAQRKSMDAIVAMEKAVLDAPLTGTVLRCGNFYGPGSSESTVELIKGRKFPLVGSGAGVWSWLHIDDAASATVAAVEQAPPGVYHVVDDDPAPVSEWLPYLAEVIGAKAPLRLPEWLGRLLAGAAPVQWMTEGRGASNEKIKSELGWTPTWSSWRQGFKDGLTDPQIEAKG